MNAPSEDTGDERLLDDYLFSEYKTDSKSTFDLDQQFAIPIQDEDIFNLRGATPEAPSPSRLKLMNMKQNFLEQARAMSIKPNKIGTDFDADGTVEFVVEQSQLVSDSDSKFLFNKVFNKSKKASDFCETPEGIKESWALQRTSLVKTLCAQKRKIWDTFQRPVDNFDDEEELIELPDDEKKDKMDEKKDKMEENEVENLFNLDADSSNDDLEDE